MSPIILASGSPRRKQLLEWAEVPFDIVVQHTNEDFPPGLDPRQAAIYIARQKAMAVHVSHPEKTILAADTMVVTESGIIGKPRDRQDALDILGRLSGRKHQVITGVVILHGQEEISFADSTDVHFHELSAEQIRFYVDKYEPYDKAGAYAIQEWIGVVGIRSVNGDFYNVMGLPVSRVVQTLKRIGLVQI